MTEHDDYSVVQSCLSGETGAFEILVERYQKAVFNTALRISNNFEGAEDITQNVFIKVFENLRKYNPKFKFFSWIYRMAINEAINYTKQSSNLAGLNNAVTDTQRRPDEHYENLEFNALINDALADLNIDHRAVIILRHFEGFSYREISYLLDVPEKTVKSRLFSARQLLKDILIRKGIGYNAST